ncbi:MAG: ABC transporter permease [Anaerolineae bacterium]|jgi:ABC-2 type transport system permease protein
MARRIRNLIRKELIQLGRDWVLTGFIITLPVFQLLLLAQSTTESIVGLNVAVVDRDRSAASRRVVRALSNKEELEVSGSLLNDQEASRLLDRGEAILMAVIPEGFSRALRNPADTPSIQLVADGSNDLVAGIALGAARGALGDLRIRKVSAPGAVPASLVDLRTSVRFNPTFDVKLFALPAQVGFIVYQVTLTVASIGVARERELGTLEQLIVTPLTRMELVAGKAAPALIVGMVNFLSMLGVTVWGFGLPLRGSLWLLLVLTLLFVGAEIGYGMLISGIAHTQQQAILLVFVQAMVDMTFSGYLVPVKNLPAGLRWIAQLVPLRHYLTLIRSVMLRGASLRALWPHAAAMLGVGALVMVVSVRTLSRRLD